MPAAILALRGELRVRGPGGDRSIKAEEFFLGLMSTALTPTDILTEIRVPVLSRHCGTAYLKVPQKASGFAIVGVAVWLKLNQSGVCEDIGVGVTGLGAKAFRAERVEERMRGEKLSPTLIEAASFHAAEGADRLDDIHASAEFRAHLARVYTARAIEATAKKAEG
jgi:carbon-monoxide dehydrogenase medium subunit